MNLSRQTMAIAALHVLALSSCHGETRAPVAAPLPGSSMDQKLALMAPGGTAPVDRQIQKLEDAVTHTPASYDTWIELGQNWVRKARETASPGIYASANACAEVVLTASPGYRHALDLRSLVMLNDHRFAEARTLATDLVTREPRDDMAYGTLSDALVELGRYDEADDAVQKMLDLRPNLPSYSRAAYLMWLRGDLKRASETVQLAMSSGAHSQDPEPRAWVITQAAQMLWSQGDLDVASAGYEKALEVLPDFPPALVGRARIAIARKQFAAAAVALQRAWAQNPLVETAYLLGEAYEAQGDTVSAAKAFDLVLQRGLEADRRILAIYLADRGIRLEQAVRLASTERQLRPDIYSDDAYAWTLFKAGRVAEARPIAEHALRLNTPDSRLLFHAGAIALASGDANTGRARLTLALKLNPAFDVFEAREAQALLATTPNPHHAKLAAAE